MEIHFEIRTVGLFKKKVGAFVQNSQELLAWRHVARGDWARPMGHGGPSP